MFGPPKSSGVSRSVQHTRELERVRNLPRRTWTQAEESEWAQRLTNALKRPHGTMILRPIQAKAIYEAGAFGGLFGPIGVGQGKTLISMLIPFVMKARRPLLLTRAALIEKTKREQRDLAQHWPIPNFIRIESYELLGRTQHAQMLELYRPDLIVADEAHRLKNHKAACTKRVKRYLEELAPGTAFVAISGTILGRSVKECAHLLRWSLGPGAMPLPNHFTELEDWGEVLDVRTLSMGESNVYPGALKLLCTPEERIEPDEIQACRKAWSRRLVETPGVVSSGSDTLGCSLTIQAVETDMKPDVIDQAFTKLRGLWRTPDDWPLSDPMQVWRVCGELGEGFYYKWDPRPPQPWIDARKEWASVCREILTNNRRNLDSELQVIHAIDQGHYPQATGTLEAWRKIRDSFVPNSVPVWLDDSAIQYAARWALSGKPGIVWVSHTATGKRLARETNLSYYQQGGLDERGRFIEDATGQESVIASIASNSEGRNLQRLFSRNLVLGWPTSGKTSEQLLGRTHRSGQLADEVTFDVLITCLEHVTAFEQARRDARTQETLLRQTQKLNYADIIFPTPDEIMAFRQGPRWIK